MTKNKVFVSKQSLGLNLEKEVHGLRIDKKVLKISRLFASNYYLIFRK